MTTQRNQQSDAPKIVRHPARPVEGPLDIKAMHDRTAKRFPRILAELAK